MSDVPFHDGMTPLDDHQIVSVVHVRLDVVVDRRRLGEPGQHVEVGHRPGRILDGRRRRRDLASERLEQTDFPLQNLFVGPQHLVLVVLEGGGYETFAPGGPSASGDRSSGTARRFAFETSM